MNSPEQPQPPSQLPASTESAEPRPVPPSLGLVRAIARVTATATIARQGQVRPSAFVVSPREVDFAVKPGGEMVERRPDVDGSTLVMIPLWTWPTEQAARQFLRDYLIRTDAYGYVLSSEAYATTFSQYLKDDSSIRDIPTDDRFNVVAIVTVNRNGEFALDLAKVKVVKNVSSLEGWRLSNVEKVVESPARFEGIFELLRW